MGVLTRLFRGSGPRAATPENPTFNLNSPDAWEAFGAAGTSTGQSISAESVLTWAAWWRGVNFLAKVLAKCPCQVYETDPEGEYGAAPALMHPAYRLLRWKPNEYQTAFQFKLALAGHAINRGNGYAYIYRNGPAPAELMLLDPDQTDPVMVGGSLWYVAKIDGEKRKLPHADVFHLRGFGFDGIRGYPLWQYAKECVALGLSAERFRGSRYKNAARPSVVLTTPNKMNDQAMGRLRNDWERMHTGLDNSHRTAVLDNGLNATTLSFSPEQMQEVESAGLSLRDAANFLGIPSSKLGDVAGVKYASKEQDDRNAMEDGADYWLCAFEYEARDKLLLPSEQEANSHLVAFDRDTLIAFDLSTKANYYRTATGGRGWMSPAEVREREHLEPRDEPDIDVILTPLNMGQGGQDNQPRDPADPGSGRPTNEEPGTGDSNADQTQSGTGLYQAPVQMSAVREAARVALTDAARRMVRRVAVHGGGPPREPKKYLAWLESFYTDHKEVVRDAFEPARVMALALIGEPAESALYPVADTFLAQLLAEYGSLADRYSAAKLPAAIEELNDSAASLMTRLMCEKFLGGGNR